MKIRTYSELSQIEGFKERYRYLALKASVGVPTFGFDRWMNQAFYTSVQWRHIRSHVIARDEGCDMGVEGYEIGARLYIHHMNPLTAQQLVQGSEDVIDPEFLITVTHLTHNAIHYGDEKLLTRAEIVERRPGDTKLW